MLRLQHLKYVQLGFCCRCMFATSVMRHWGSDRDCAFLRKSGVALDGRPLCITRALASVWDTHALASATSFSPRKPRKFKVLPCCFLNGVRWSTATQLSSHCSLATGVALPFLGVEVKTGHRRRHCTGPKTLRGCKKFSRLNLEGQQCRRSVAGLSCKMLLQAVLRRVGHPGWLLLSDPGSVGGQMLEGTSLQLTALANVLCSNRTLGPPHSTAVS